MGMFIYYYSSFDRNKNAGYLTRGVRVDTNQLYEYKEACYSSIYPDELPATLHSVCKLLLGLKQ